MGLCADELGSPLLLVPSRSEVSCCFRSFLATQLTGQAISSPTRKLISIRFALHELMISSATRIQLRKGRAEERIAKLQDSPDMPEGEATYVLKVG